MTSYLQRVASSAINPGGSVRPVAGTVFSPSRYRTAPGPAVVEQEILAARPDDMDARRGSAPRPAAREAAPLQGGAREPQEARSGIRQAPGAPPGISAHKPAAVQGPGRTAPGAQPGADRDSTVGARPAHSPEPGLPVRRAGEAGEAGQGERRAALPRDEPRGPERAAVGGMEAGEAHFLRVKGGPRERPFVPVVAGEFGPPAPYGGNTAVPADPARSAADRERSRASGVPAAPREPDEINIHIGRIEVTAAQPPPLRPAAPKSHRKAPSLEEYLRRRGGRIP